MAADIEFFDVEAYLDDRHIESTRSGKNVTAGWIEIACPFCGDDPSFHLGISPKNLFNCWRCRKKGNVATLIMKLEDCDFSAANAILQRFKNYYITDTTPAKKTSNETILPKEASDNFLPHHLAYLESRGFDPQFIIRKYGLKVCNHTGDFKFRFIVPIFEGGRIVNFVGMDYTRKSKTRYKNCPTERAVIPTKECVYNLDNARDKAIVVEGITDVWKFGDGAVAVLGISFTTKQALKIINHGIKEVLVIFDGELEASEKSRELYEKLLWSTEVKVSERIVPPDDVDPASMSTETVSKIKKEFFGR